MTRSIAVALLASGLLSGCSHSSRAADAPVAPAAPVAAAGGPPSVVMNVDNQVRLMSTCSDVDTLTFFQGYTPKNVPVGTVTPVTVASMWGTYKIGFQVNGWYWRCAGAASCPNPNNCQNPDNAGQVGIVVTPAASGTGCTSAALDATWTMGLCDGLVPSARNVVTVTLEDPASCRVKVTASNLPSIAPTPGCCNCSTCTSPPGNQKPHCQ